MDSNSSSMSDSDASDSYCDPDFFEVECIVGKRIRYGGVSMI